jgi:hypothetical protein
LSGLKPHLLHDSAFIIATRNLGSLGIRRRALLAQAYLPDWREPPVLFSMNWPDLPSYRYYLLSEVIEYARDAGLLAVDIEYAMGERAFSNADFLSLASYLERKVMHWARKVQPTFRDYLVMTLLPATPSESSLAAVEQGVAKSACPVGTRQGLVL